MQTRNPFFDEAAKVMEQAIGLAQAAGEEARSALRAQGDRMAAELDLVRRDEMEAMRAALSAEIAGASRRAGRPPRDRPIRRGPDFPSGVTPVERFGASQIVCFQAAPRSGLALIARGRGART